MTESELNPLPVLAIPAALRRAGTKRVVDNVPPGAFIAGFEPEFVRLFASVIKKKLFTDLKGENHG